MEIGECNSSRVLWKGIIEEYREFFPVTGRTPVVSLLEGNTPLVKAANLPRKLNIDLDIYLKFDGANPTGSFKDRGSSVEISKVLEFNAKKVICASTGNMGASVAAYSGIANLDCSIFVSKHAPRIKMEQILAYGAKLYHVNADYAETTKMAEEACKKIRHLSAWGLSLQKGRHEIRGI